MLVLLSWKRKLERQRKKTDILAPSTNQVVNIVETKEVRTICVLLVIHGVISYRAVPRVLQLLQGWGRFPFFWIPNFTSVINWTLRLGLALLKDVEPVDHPWVAIMDHSITIGIKKVLVILRVPLDILKNKGSAIGLKDCECVGIDVSEKTDGETVASALTRIFEKAGDPAVILKDGGPDIARAVKLWKEAENKGAVLCIDDLGHWISNALKAHYAKNDTFLHFLKAINLCSARLRQTQLAFLIPPKIRTKGRFMSISQLGRWASHILVAIGGKGRAKNNSQLDRLRKAMPAFCVFRPFIQRFAMQAKVMSEIMKILKHQGLNRETYHQAMAQLDTLPIRSPIKKRVVKFLKKHLSIHCRLGIGQMPLLVSSDIIESLFGKYKHIIERGPGAEINRNALVIPTLCGIIDSDKLEDAFTHVQHKEVDEWSNANIGVTLRMKRQEFMENTPLDGYQIPGILEAC